MKDGYVKGISFFLGRLEDLEKQAGVLFSDDLVDLGQSLFGRFDAGAKVLVLELDDFLEFFVAFLVEVQMKDLNVLEL